MDVYETPLGIRSLKFDAEKGFFLNNKSLKFQSVFCITTMDTQHYYKQSGTQKVTLYCERDGG